MTTLSHFVMIFCVSVLHLAGFVHQGHAFAHETALVRRYLKVETNPYRSYYRDTTKLALVKDRLAFVQKKRESLVPSRARREGESRGAAFRRNLRRVLGYPVRRVGSLFRKTPVGDPVGDLEPDSLLVIEAVTEVLVPVEPEVGVTDYTTDTEVVDEKPEVSEKATTDGIIATSAASEESSFSPSEDGRSKTASGVDLSGKWGIIVTDDFKEQYENYLTLLGQPLLVRSVALSIVAMTTEETEQSEKGKELFIRGKNVRGTWDRTLTTAEPGRIFTADGEDVEGEAWWEDGTVHRSWLRGVKRYGGGDFESKRYLESGGKVLVCESTFHPKDDTREKAKVTWRFLREGEKL
jgi:hypothetical protein